MMVSMTSYSLLSQKEFSEQKTHLKLSEKKLSVVKPLVDIDPCKIVRYILAKYPDGQGREREIGTSRVFLDGTIAALHGTYPQKQDTIFHQSKSLPKYSSFEVALLVYGDSLKYAAKYHKYIKIFDKFMFYSEKTNENIRNKKPQRNYFDASPAPFLEGDKAARQIQAKVSEMQRLHEYVQSAKENVSNIDLDTKVKLALVTLSVLNEICSVLFFFQSLLEGRSKESSVTLTLLAQWLETKRSSLLLVNTPDDDAHLQNAVNNFMLNIESNSDFVPELNLYILTRILQSACETASEMNTLRETYILLRCAVRGFDVWLKSGVSIDIGKCFQKLRGFIILCSQDSIGGKISEATSLVRGHSLTMDKKGQVPVVQNGSPDVVIESSPAVAEVKLDRITHERVNCLRNKAEGNLPEMIVAQDISGNYITRPYGIPVPVSPECSTNGLLEEATLKTLCVGDPNADAAQIREESSNLSDYTNIPSPVKDSDTKSSEQSSEPDLSLPSTALLRGQSAEQLQTDVQAKMFETETTVEEMTSQESSADEVRKDRATGEIDADPGENSTLASAHYVADSDSDCDFKDTCLKKGLSDGSNQIHGTLDKYCSDQNQGDLIRDTLETDGTSVQNADDSVQPPNMPVLSDHRTTNEVREVELYASDARVFQAPIQAYSPENSGLYLCYENGYCYEGLSDSSSQAESAGKSSSSYPTSSTSTDQYTAQEKLCEAVPENRSSPNIGFGESFCGQEEFCTGRTQNSAKPSQTSGHLTPITAVQEQSSYFYVGQEPGCCPHNIIAHPTDEIPQTSISSSTSHTQSVNCTALNILAPSQFSAAIGASHQASLVPPHGVPDCGLQPPLIVHAAGSRPPRTFAGQNFLDISHARYPEHRDLRARRATYNRTWDLIDSEADPASMALAGFFRPDPQRPRCVRCFYCGLELDFNGQSGWEEHLRHSPSCQYLRVMGGEQFVKEEQIRRTRK